MLQKQIINAVTQHIKLGEYEGRDERIREVLHTLSSVISTLVELVEDNGDVSEFDDVMRSIIKGDL